jgi:hypothetical protein
MLSFVMTSLIPTFSQESVGVVHGKGILINQGRSPNRGLSQSLRSRRSMHGSTMNSQTRTREAAEEEDDIYGARWAATELFRLDNGNQRPTKMSDVYSFACLMLQVRLSIYSS